MPIQLKSDYIRVARNVRKSMDTMSLDLYESDTDVSTMLTAYDCDSPQWSLGESSASGHTPLSTLILNEIESSKKKEIAKIKQKLDMSLCDRSGVSYARTLRIFLPIYLELEKLQKHNKKHPAVGAVMELFGLPSAFMRDIQHFNVPAPFHIKSELKAVAALVSHLRLLGDHNPLLLCPYLFIAQLTVLGTSKYMKSKIISELRLNPTSNRGRIGGIELLSFDFDQLEELILQSRLAIDSIGQGLNHSARKAIIEESQRVVDHSYELIRRLHLRPLHITLGLICQCVPYIFIFAAIYLNVVVISIVLAINADVM